ncbi:glycosyltransferase family 39 protein [Patescibacteria group bacterium]|nr:glycosyltransferase family 39 protein [Patescibacteria group bacterium]
MEKIKTRVKKFLQKNNYLILLILIILLAAFLRFWRLPEYMTFLGDEGRDVLAVKRMIVDHKFRLIGPVTSVGNMYLGPLYYYLMLPAMAVFRLSPVGPAALVALLGIITTALIYFFGREWVCKKGAIIASFLYAISPVIIIYSRSSWNPNVMPFFALVSVYGLWRVWQKKQFWWLPVIGVTLSFAVQSHYLGLLLIPIVFIFQAITFCEVVKDRKEIKKFILLFAICYLLFAILTIAPLVWFDLRHGFINYQAFKKFFTDSQGTINFKIYKAIPHLWLLTKEVFTRLLAGKDIYWGRWIALIMSLMVGLKVIRENLLADWHRFITRNAGLFLILVWFLVGLLGLGNYQQPIYDHYFGFFFPVPFLLVGWFLGMTWVGKIWGKLFTLLVIGFLVFLAVKESPLRYPPARQLQRTQVIARFVLDKAGDKPFNLALVAERNYDEAYAFFMEKWGQPPTRIEPEKAKETITQQLFVICEQAACQPIYQPKAEIAMFGWTKIAEKWQIEGVEVYKLIHYEKRD